MRKLTLVISNERGLQASVSMMIDDNDQEPLPSPDGLGNLLNEAVYRLEVLEKQGTRKPKINLPLPLPLEP